MYKKLTRLLPKRARKYLKKQVRYAGFKEEFGYKFVGFSILFSIFLAVITAFDLYLFYGLIGIVIGVVVGFVFLFTAIISIVFIADSRATEIEKVLPDALQLIAANTRAGMTTDRAIWLSARPEFGILEEEIRLVGARTVGGKSTKDALSEMAKNIKSSILDRTVKLINEGIESGGELAHLLEETSNNIRTTQTLRKEIKASVTTYSIFILFASVVGAPMLFAISLFFVEVMGKLWGPQVLAGAAATGAGAGGIGTSFIRAGEISITPNEIFWFAIGSITVTTLFGSIIIGLIRYGEAKRGVKYIPILLGGALFIFFMARFLIEVLFGQFFNL